jgi:hypothetical protein
MKAILSYVSASPAEQTTETTGLAQSNKQLTNAEATGTLYRQKFELASEFVSSLQFVLAATDRLNTSTQFLWYHTVWYILKHAFSNHPVHGIIYKKVLISRGVLWNANKAEAKAKAASTTLIFKWSNDSGTDNAKRTDRCIVVAYCEALNKCLFSAEGIERHARKATLEVPEFRGHAVHTWLAFMSADGKKASNSVYTGRVIIT